MLRFWIVLLSSSPKVVTGRKEITRESAAQIGAAFGHTAEYWLIRQHQYLLAEQSRNKNTQVKLDEVRRRARLYDKAPIRLLTRRGLLTGATLDALEVEVKELFDGNDSPVHESEYCDGEIGKNCRCFAHPLAVARVLNGDDHG